MLFAGHGTQYDSFNSDGGDGGDIFLVAGMGHGENKETDTGGDVHITGGASRRAAGGNLFFKSGPGEHGEGRSGDVNVSIFKSWTCHTVKLVTLTSCFPSCVCPVSTSYRRTILASSESLEWSTLALALVTEVIAAKS